MYRFPAAGEPEDRWTGPASTTRRWISTGRGAAGAPAPRTSADGRRPARPHAIIQRPAGRGLRCPQIRARTGHDGRRSRRRRIPPPASPADVPPPAARSPARSSPRCSSSAMSAGTRHSARPSGRSSVPSKSRRYRRDPTPHLAHISIWSATGPAWPRAGLRRAYLSRAARLAWSQGSAPAFISASSPWCHSALLGDERGHERDHADTVVARSRASTRPGRCAVIAQRPGRSRVMNRASAVEGVALWSAARVGHVDQHPSRASRHHLAADVVRPPAAGSSVAESAQARWRVGERQVRTPSR